VQFGFTQHAAQPKQQAVVVVARLKDPGTVGEQGSDHRREVKQGIPVGVVAREATGFVGQNDPDLAKRDRGNHLVEARTLAILTGVALVVVNDVDAFTRPAECQSTVNEGILILLAGPIFTNLARGGLANVDVGASLKMGRCDLLSVVQHHEGPP
jgi:hypothetical protein